MNAPISIGSIPALPWVSVEQEVDAFRGRIINLHTLVETAVRETLLVLRNAVPADKRIPLPHLGGECRETLRTAMEALQQQIKPAAKVLVALDDYERCEAGRTIFCHGVAKVSLDRDNRWCLTLRQLTFRSNLAERSCYVVYENEAADVLAALDRCRTTLCGALGHVRKAVVG